MTGENPDNLRELFARFLAVDEANAAAEEVRRAEQLLELYPAPQPNAQAIAAIKRQVAARVARRHRFRHLPARLAPAAAAVILLALFARFGHKPTSQHHISYASLIPTAIWESDDISADDAELAYYTAELEQIEAQMRSLEAGEADNTGADTLHEVEMELMRIDTEFWKE
jgi:cell division protein FtsB